MRLSLRGLTLAPSQVRGAIRLVPLLRAQPRPDLRLWARSQPERVSVVTLSGEKGSPGLHYWSVVPSALILEWTDDGAPLSSLSGQIVRAKDRPSFRRLEQRMAKRESDRALRFFPQHLALEGLLATHYAGPEIAWNTWSQQVIRHGLDPRSERVIAGAAISGLDEALRTFELHPDQVGVLVYVAEVFGAAFVLPSPQDYRPLHRSLLTDCFGEILASYAVWHPTVYPWTVPAERAPTDLADLRAQLDGIRAGWASFQAHMAEDLLGEDLRWTPVYRAGPFSLTRFLPTFSPGTRAHVGEVLVDDEGEVQYLKTTLLSDETRERAWWLDQLASVAWELPKLAEKLGQPEEQVRRRLARAGWAGLLRVKPR